MSARFTHGASGYSNYHCRCAVCKRGWAEWMYGFTRSILQPYCAVPECNDPQYAKGVCKAHYERRRRGVFTETPVRKKPQARRKYEGGVSA